MDKKVESGKSHIERYLLKLIVAKNSGHTFIFTVLLFEMKSNIRWVLSLSVRLPSFVRSQS